MNADKQRIAIAELCGWTRLDQGQGYGRPPLTKTDFKIPDYLTDLNAMHEAEKTLPSELTLNYDKLLHTSCHQAVNDNNIPRVMYAWHATAVQRAEAFLRTIGKWEYEA